MIKDIIDDKYCKKIILATSMLLSIGAVVMFFLKSVISFKAGALFMGVLSSISVAFWICMIAAICWIVYRDFFKKKKTNHKNIFEGTPPIGDDPTSSYDPPRTKWFDKTKGDKEIRY